MPKNFLHKMPLKKRLSYSFARIADRDILCTRMACHVYNVQILGEFNPNVIVGSMKRYDFSWYEAKPVVGENGLYTLNHFSFSRNGRDSVGGNFRLSETGYRRTHADARHGVYFTRDEAIALLKQYEKAMLETPGYRCVDKAPWSLSGLSVHRAAVSKPRPAA